MSFISNVPFVSSMFNVSITLFDERTYFMGEPSPTTEKRGMRPDDEIVDKDATKFL